MRAIAILALTSLCGLAAQDDVPSLKDARDGFRTELLRRDADPEPLEPPPAELFSLDRYPGPVGELQAYVSRPDAAGPSPDRRRPAILWITGGFPPGGCGSSAWEPVPQSDDQSAKVYRQAGLVMIYPTTRGTFGNPGVQEGFFGEVDDVLAALEYVRGLDFVDPERIYLGGHSTGGTLALLVAAATDGFRAVFAFGPVEDPATYGDEYLPYDADDPRECALRAPIAYLRSIRSPTFVIEGTVDSNLDSLRVLERAERSDAVRFLVVPGANHFDVLGPANRVIADAIASLGGDEPIRLTVAAIEAALQAQHAVDLEAEDLSTLAELRDAGVPFDEPQTVRFMLFADEKGPLEALAKAADGFDQLSLTAEVNRDGEPFFALVLGRRLTLGAIESVFAASAAMDRMTDRREAFYYGFTVW